MTVKADGYRYSGGNGTSSQNGDNGVLSLDASEVKSTNEKGEFTVIIPDGIHKF